MGIVKVNRGLAAERVPTSSNSRVRPLVANPSRELRICIEDFAGGISLGTLYSPCLFFRLEICRAQSTIVEYET